MWQDCINVAFPKYITSQLWENTAARMGLGVLGLGVLGFTQH